MVGEQEVLSSLSAQVIDDELRSLGQNASLDLCVMESTSSTNDQVMLSLNKRDALFCVCVADQQTAGKGRNGTAWVSPPNANIYMSIGTRLDVDLLAGLGGLSLACGVVIAKCLSELGVDVGIKWPNDILFEQKKLAGILVETKVKAQKLYVVVGLGLNVKMPELGAKEIDQPWVDLQSIFKKKNIKLDRNWLVGNLLNEIVECIQRFVVSGFGAYVEDWKKFDVLTGRKVLVKTDVGECEALVLGVADDCALRVSIDNQEKSFYAADIKLKIN